MQEIHLTMGFRSYCGQRRYQDKQQQPQMQLQESDDEDNSTNRSGLSFPGSLSELFNERDSQQLGDLLGGFVRQFSKIELNPIPGLTRLIKMDRVGFEPTASATVC
jgi:hypothetical protein